MPLNLSEQLDILPGNLNLSDAKTALSDPKNLDYHRVLGEILDNTSVSDRVLEEIQQFVDLEILVREFPKIRSHMKHANLEGSTREEWEQKIMELGEELGIKTDQLKRIPGRSDSSAPRQPDEESTGEGRSRRTSAEQDRERKSIGQKLNNMRTKKGLSRNQVAQNCELSLKKISSLEKGHERLTYDALREYARGLGMKLQIDFREAGEDSDVLLQEIHGLIDDATTEMTLDTDVERCLKLILFHMAEHALYKKRFATVIDTLEYLEKAARNFTVLEESPDRTLFANEPLYKQINQQLSHLDISDLAFEEKVRAAAQKMLEIEHDVESEE